MPESELVALFYSLMEDAGYDPLRINWSEVSGTDGDEERPDI